MRALAAPVLVVPALLVVGVGMSAWQPLSMAEILELGREAAQQPLLTAAIVIAMVLLFSFGMPGSIGLWVIAPFYPPLVATVLLLASSVGGALGAYLLSDRLSVGWQPKGLALRVQVLLATRGDFLTQVALRVLPGFPHAVVNFSAGMLRLPLPTFLLAALIGLAVKWAVYTSAVHGLVAAAEGGTAIGLETLAPLVLLSLLLLLGNWVRRKLGTRHAS